jgi:hypothetical protein
VFVSVLDASGQVVDDRFAISPPLLTNITVDSGSEIGGLPTWDLGPQTTGTSRWTLLPTDLAAPTGPTQYNVGGVITYVLGGVRYTVPMAHAPITVYPDAALGLKYFHERDVFSDDPHTEPVEPSLPYDLGVMVTNSGAGSARNLRIVSSQPRIVENEKGLLIDFQILSTQVDSQPVSPSLTADFGVVAPGQTKVGLWKLSSSLQGQFTDYKASFEHLTGFGDRRTSLIKQVEIHESIHTVIDPRPAADDRYDFLANDIKDDSDLPDTIHLSDGTVAPVGLGSLLGFDHPPTPGALSVQISAAMPDAWGYLKFNDPSAGQYRLVQVTRADGSTIPLGTNAWTTDRTFIEGGKRPVYENLVHLVDFAGSSSYTLLYAPLDQTGPTVEQIQEIVPNPAENPLVSLDLSFSEPIDPASFDRSDVMLTRDGSGNLIDAGVTVQALSPTSYRIGGLAALTTALGAYTLAVDAAGVTDVWNNAGTGSGAVTWLMAGNLVSVIAFANVPTGATNSSVPFADVTFSRPINVDSFQRDDVSLARDGGPNLIDAGVTIAPLSDRAFRIGNLAALNDADGAYRLTVNAAGVLGLDGTSGIGQGATQWLRDSVSPHLVSLSEINTNPRNTVVPYLDVVLSESIDLATFERGDLLLTRDANPTNLIDNRVGVSHLGGSSYRIEGFNWVVGQNGSYTLSVNGAGLRDAAGNPAVGALERSWVMDISPPEAPFDLAVSPDRGSDAADGLTNSGLLILTGSVAEPLPLVRLFDLSTQSDLGESTVIGTTFSKAIHLVELGPHRIQVRATDLAGNISPRAIFDVFVDTTPPEIFHLEMAIRDDETAPLTAIDVVFTERVNLATLDYRDLRLTRDGGADLIDGSVTISQVSGSTYRIHGLGALNQEIGVYELSVDGQAVEDLAGNLASDLVSESWTVSHLRADVVPVLPNPRIDPVDALTIHFSDPVTEFDLADLRLARDGGVSLLSAAQSLTTSDQQNWTLGNLAGLTGPEGRYRLSIVAGASGAVNRLGGALRADVEYEFVVDLTMPTVGLEAVTPDPRTSPIDQIAVTFSEAVVGFDLFDLSLVRAGGSNLLESGATLATTDNRTWTLAGLAALTSPAGNYQLSLSAVGSGITDVAGNPLAFGANESFTVQVAVVQRAVFYNGSTWDGNNLAANTSDDAAIDTTKSALLPGQTGGFANYTGYSRGLNGIMVDIAGPHGTIGADDFSIKVGNNNTPGSWAAGPAPTSVTLRAGAGSGGSDRYTLIWANNAIQKTWLQVTLLANANTGLSANDVFYFGNAIGEVGNTSANAFVTSADEALIRLNFTTGFGTVPVTAPYDIDKNRFVQTSDAALSRVNQTTAFSALRLIVAPSEAGSPAIGAALAGLAGDGTAGWAGQQSRRRRR